MLLSYVYPSMIVLRPAVIVAGRLVRNCVVVTLSLLVLGHAPTMHLNQAGPHLAKDVFAGVCSGLSAATAWAHMALPHWGSSGVWDKCYNKQAKNVDKMSTLPERRSSISPGGELPRCRCTSR